MPRIRKPISKTEHRKPTVIRDTREHAGQGWEFGGSHSYFEDTVTQTLKTGDYSLVGLDKVVCIERKGTPGELFGNIFDAEDFKRFNRELARMRKFPVAAIILEFSVWDVINWKQITNIPHAMKSRMHDYAFLSKLTEFYIEYPSIQLIFAGRHGKEMAGYVLKKAYQQYGYPY